MTMLKFTVRVLLFSKEPFYLKTEPWKFACIHLLGYPIRSNNTIRANRELTSRKIRQYLTVFDV